MIYDFFLLFLIAEVVNTTPSQDSFWKDKSFNTTLFFIRAILSIYLASELIHILALLLQQLHQAENKCIDLWILPKYGWVNIGTILQVS